MMIPRYLPLLAGLACGWLATPPVEPARADPVAVAARPVPLDPADPGLAVAGKLRYRGGLHVVGAEPHFGGFSGLGISADGGRLVAVSDRGWRLSANLIYDAAGNLAGLKDADMGSLSDLRGFPLTDRMEWEAEAMSPGVEGEIIIAFEGAHRLWRYFPGRTVPEPLPPPEELAAMPPNSGIKGLTLLNDGRLLALTPGIRGRAGAIGWVSDSAGWSVLTYRSADDYQVTGAATLPDGDALLLERLFILRGGNAALLKRVPVNSIEAGAVLVGQTVAELRPPLTVDNFEGVEARRGANGETLIYLISDDNFSPEQRTLLMMFELLP
jgi:hypothetical protein